jgi:hypothetical protein
MKSVAHHAWTFSPEGYKRLLVAAGLTCLYNSSAYIGKYIGKYALDWNTCVGAPFVSWEKALSASFNFGSRPSSPARR